MIARKNHTFRTDNTGRELFENDRQAGLAFNVIGNDYPVLSVVPHWHEQLEAVLLLEGSAEAILSGEKLTISAGEACFINAGTLHGFSSQSGAHSHYHSIVFDSSIVSGMVGSVFETNYVRPLLESGPTFIHLDREAAANGFAEAFDRAFAALDSEGAAYEFTVRNALSDMILLMIRLSHVHPPHRLSRVNDALAKQMISWIDAHMTEEITLQDIAAAAAVSPRECQRIFDRCLHRSPMNYLNKRRLYAAADALVSSDAPVTEIALNCGFASPSYFTQQFRRLFNVTPREYRSLFAQDGP